MIDPWKTIKDKWQAYKDRRFLKKHNVSTWEQYNHVYDPDANRRADRVKEYFKNYKHVIMIENYDNYAYELICDYGPGGQVYGYGKINDWCKENITAKWRVDILRVFKQTGLTQIGNGIDWIEEPEWFINEIGGRDYLYYAFMSDEDAFRFKLRWGL